VSDTAAPSSPLSIARGFADARDWRGLVEWGASLPDVHAEDPEVGYLYADACRRTGDTATATEVLARVEPRVRQGGDRHLLRRTVNLAGITEFEAGRVPQAEQRFLELMEIASAEADDDFMARACNNLGAVANLRGQRELAIPYYTRAMAAYQRAGRVRGLAQTHYNLGLSFRDIGYAADADAHLRRAMDFAAESETEEVTALAEVERANLRVRAGDGALATELARRALERFERIGDPTGAAQAIRIVGLAALAQGDEAEAQARLDEALEIARAHEDALLRAEVQRDRGLLLRDRGEGDAAREAFADAIEHFRQIGAAAEAEALRVILDALGTAS